MNYFDRRKKVKHQVINSGFGLNITSMTDMFTILLVFLLQTYSASDVVIQPENGLTLPRSISSTDPTKGLQIKISPKQLKVEEAVISDLQNLEFTKSDLDRSDSELISMLLAKLKEARASTKESQVLLQADAQIPYQTLKKIFYTATMAGFESIKLVTLADGSGG